MSWHGSYTRRAALRIKKCSMAEVHKTRDTRSEVDDWTTEHGDYKVRRGQGDHEQCLGDKGGFTGCTEGARAEQGEVQSDEQTS